MVKIRAVESFDKIPVDLCPCMLTIKTCQRDDTKEIFEVGIAKGVEHKTWYLHLKGDLFARKLCLILMKEAKK